MMRARTQARQSPSAPDGRFVRLAVGRKRLCIDRALAPFAPRILSALDEFRATRGQGAGNRQSAFRLKLEGAPEIVARQARRGGLMRMVASDLYFGIYPRPLRELEVTLEARRRGIPVAEPLGAIYQWAAPALYRGFFLTRAMSGMTLWEFIRTDDDAVVRDHVLGQARAAIESTFAHGLFHPDLNLHNLFVTSSGESLAVMILDLDKARLYAPPLPQRMRASMLARLARSAHKLDPAGRFIDAAAAARLGIG
jgi:hypothetical protein